MPPERGWGGGGPSADSSPPGALSPPWHGSVEGGGAPVQGCAPSPAGVMTPHALCRRAWFHMYQLLQHR